MTTESELPVVVVGGGTAGLAFIVEFVKHCDRALVLVEPGVHVEDSSSQKFLSVVNSGTTWPQRKAVLVEGEPEVSYVQARALGGGSAINGMLNLAWSDHESLAHVTAASVDEVGVVGQALIENGGLMVPLSWRDGQRTNDVREVTALIENGRVRHVAQEVTRLLVQGDSVVGVETDEAIEASHVVLCAGVFATIEILNSTLFETGLHCGQNVSDHPSITFTFPLTKVQESAFDATVYLPFESVPGDSASRSLIIGYERESSDDASHGMVSVLLMNPTSEGWIDTSSGRTIAHFNMLSTESDGAYMSSALHRLIEFALNDSLAINRDDMKCGTSSLSLTELVAMTVQERSQWMRMNLSPVSHISGGATASQLTAIERLSVIDAASFERVPEVLPNRMVAENGRKAGNQLGKQFKRQ